MKKLLLILTSTVFMSGAAFAAGTWTFTPSTTSISGLTGSVDVTLSLTTTSANISSWDMFLGSNSAGANAFSLDPATTSLQTGSAASGAGSYPDAFAAPTNAVGVNGTNYFTFQNYDPDNSTNGRDVADQGFSFSTDKTITG